MIGGAGAAVNALIAFLLLTAMYVVGYDVPASQTRPAIIGWVDADSPASRAGIETGDRITRIGTTETPHWEDVNKVIAFNAGNTLELDVIHNSHERRCSIASYEGSWQRVRSVGWHPVMAARIELVERNSPAEQAGLQRGDEIVSIDKMPITYWPRINEQLRNEDMQVVYVRNGRTIDTQLRPRQIQAPGTTMNAWTIGVAFQEEMVRERQGFLGAAWKSITTIGTFTLLTAKAVPKLFSGGQSLKPSLGFPASFRLSTEATQFGVQDLIIMIALLSLSLGACNLLPVPILDGGVIVVLLVEMVFRRDISESVKERLRQFGFVLIILLMILVITNDILRLHKK